MNRRFLPTPTAAVSPTAHAQRLIAAPHYLEASAPEVAAITDLIRILISYGGGVYLGLLREDENPITHECLVLFNSPASHSTLSLTLKQLVDEGSEAVRKRIAISDAKFLRRP